MALNTKTIRRRIKSVGSTKKITKAMEMISAVKMRRAVGNVLATRNYATRAWQMLVDVAAKTNVNLHPLLKKRPVEKIALILIASNRGLAGGFNSRVLMEANNFLKKFESESKNIDIFINGKKAKKIYHQFGYNIAAEFEKKDLTLNITEIYPISKMIINDYKNNKYDAVYLCYTDYISAVKQISKTHKLLPIEQNTDSSLGNIGENEQTAFVARETEFLFEPNPIMVLDSLLPKLIEMQIYQAALESDASEHSARMMAMRNASDAAEEMINELNYNFNKARQAAITQEISEIVSGAAAL
jgi:F-type H+-transporting ATPase subunit gamma